MPYFVKHTQEDENGVFISVTLTPVETLVDARELINDKHDLLRTWLDNAMLIKSIYRFDSQALDYHRTNGIFAKYRVVVMTMNEEYTIA